MANLTLSFAAALMFMWTVDFKSVVESPRMALISTLTQNSSTSGILMPGGSWTSKDGVRIVAPIGSISSPVTISVIKRNEPAESFGELANVFEPIAIYKVSSNPIGEVDSELLQLYFPVPNTANLDDYVLLQLGSVDGTTAPSSGSGAKSWSYVHRNYEKRAEILREDVGFNFDFYMIARTSLIKTPKKALSIKLVSGPGFLPTRIGAANCDDLNAQKNSSGTLMPGGQLLLAGGLKISAPIGVLEAPLQLTVANVAPSEIPLAIPEGHQVLSQFYKISSDLDVSAPGSTSFLVEIPFETTLDPKEISMFRLTPAKFIRGDTDAEYIWSDRNTELDLVNKKLTFALSSIEPEGTIYVVLYGTPRSPITPGLPQNLGR
jgi:hypothetical protein